MQGKIDRIQSIIGWLNEPKHDVLDKIYGATRPINFFVSLPYSNEEDGFSAKALSLVVYQAPMPNKPQVTVFKNPKIFIRNPNTILLALVESVGMNGMI